MTDKEKQIEEIKQIIGIDDYVFTTTKANEIYIQFIKPLEDIIKDKQKVVLQKEIEIADNEKVFEKYKRIYKESIERAHSLGLTLEKENFELKKKLNQARKETAREFAERLKSKDCSVPMHKGFILIEDYAIDQTLKEFIGEEK